MLILRFQIAPLLVGEVHEKLAINRTPKRRVREKVRTLRLRAKKEL